MLNGKADSERLCFLIDLHEEVLLNYFRGHFLQPFVEHLLALSYQLSKFRAKSDVVSNEITCKKLASVESAHL